MDLIEYFERQKQRCERELKYAEATDFRLIEKTGQGQKDVTEEHIKQLQVAREDYQWIMLDKRFSAVVENNTDLRRDFISRNPGPFTGRRARIREIVHLA